MGYTTKFTGQFNLSRQLTIAEAKFLVELADLDRTEAKQITGTDAYMQWVPTETLDGIVWDGEEKFYEYQDLLRWLCGWLAEKGVQVDGRVLWSGEDSSDVGELSVTANQVTATPGKRPGKAGKPLTSQKLGEMALKLLTDSKAA